MEIQSHPYAIKVYKEYFNFSSSHFLIFGDGTREPLHGHNYRVRVQLEVDHLESDMVFDFLLIKPIIKEICDLLDHRLLLPRENPTLEIHTEKENYLVKTPDGSFFSFPQKDVLLLPLVNTSAERLAIYLAHQVSNLLEIRYSFKFQILNLEVEETPGQSATFTLKRGK